MRRRAFLLGSLVTAAGGSSLLASGAFSQSESQRKVTVETVGDEDAYLQLVYEDRTVVCQGTVTLVELTNQLTTEITDIDVGYDSSADVPSISNLQVPENLAVGKSGDVTVDVECPPSSDAETTVTFTVQVTGNGLDLVAQDRTVDISCDCEGETSSSAGTGNESTNETTDVSINESRNESESPLLNESQNESTDS